MTIQVAAFRWVPPFAQGFVRDLRIRWALEEAGWPYEIELIDFERAKSAEYRGWQPFGQIPAYRDSHVELFESGAILLHLAERSEALAPTDPAGRARTTTWVIAALNSIEPFTQRFIEMDSAPDTAWPEDYRARTEALLDSRLGGLSAWLEGKDYLEGRFTVADIVMSTVLREMEAHGLAARFPLLEAYRARCIGRPAFQRSLEAQLATFRENEPAQI